MKAQIKILSGARSGAVAVFSKPVVTVGRHGGADLRFDPELDLDVSSRHAEIFLKDGHWYVRDSGSSNGTLINGHAIKADTRLADTDQVRFGANGPTVEFRLVSDATPDQPLGALNKPDGDTTPPGVRTTGRHAGGAAPAPAPAAPAEPRSSAGGSTTMRIRAEVVRQTKTLRNVTIGLGSLLVLVVAGFLLNARREEGAREAEAAAMQLRVDSILHASDAALHALQGQVEGLAGALRASQSSVQQLQQRLAEAQRTGNASAVADIRRQLTDAGQALSQQQAAAQVNYRDINAANGRAIAIIYVDFGGPNNTFTGTAFAIDSNGTMITNRHVVAGEDGTKHPVRIAVKFNGSKQVFRADLLGISHEADVAAVRVHVAGPVPTIKGFNAHADTVQQGDPVAVIGFPLGVELPMGGSGADAVARTTLTAGTISKVLPDLVQVDGYGAQGSSGSPIFDRNGEVVAVLYGGQAGTAGRIVFSAPASYAVRLLQSLK